MDEQLPEGDVERVTVLFHTVKWGCSRRISLRDVELAQSQLSTPLGLGRASADSGLVIGAN